MPSRTLSLALLLAALLVGCSTGQDEAAPTPCQGETDGDNCVCGSKYHDTVSACSVQSVGGHGVCCQGEDTCRCHRQVCIASATDCTCYTMEGLGYRLEQGGRIVPSCERAEGVNCCMKRDTSDFGGYCRCLPGYWICADHGEDSVESCTVARVSICGNHTQKVASCR
jgi:hypothetical protein